jgi:hypothetical protein
MSYVRTKVNNTLAPRGFNYFYIDGQRGSICQEVFEELKLGTDLLLPSIKGHYVLEDLYMPWRRMFEIALFAKYIK